ncbi:MAG: 30S ribosomal protein S20 [Planctomycetota bacterium]
MPNTKQSKKRARQDDERREHNKVLKTTMRSAMKRVLRAETAEEASAAMPFAMKRIDKAAKSNLIHENAAARFKSRLHKHAATK